MAKKAKKRVVRDAATGRFIASEDKGAITATVKVSGKKDSVAQKKRRKRSYLRERDAVTGRFVSIANEVIDDNYELLKRLAK